jgi:Fe-S-cluster containining protein
MQENTERLLIWTWRSARSGANANKNKQKTENLELPFSFRFFLKSFAPDCVFFTKQNLGTMKITYPLLPAIRQNPPVSFHQSVALEARDRERMKNKKQKTENLELPFSFRFFLKSFAPDCVFLHQIPTDSCHYKDLATATYPISRDVSCEVHSSIRLYAIRHFILFGVHYEFVEC